MQLSFSPCLLAQMYVLISLCCSSMGVCIIIHVLYFHCWLMDEDCRCLVVLGTCYDLVQSFKYFIVSICVLFMCKLFFLVKYMWYISMFSIRFPSLSAFVISMEFVMIPSYVYVVFIIGLEYPQLLLLLCTAPCI